MKEVGIHASSKGLYVWNPGRHEFYSSAGNVLGTEESADCECKHWAGDFTYIRTGSGWLYHAVVVDLYSRRIVGWSFSRKRNSELTKSALRMALSHEQPRVGCVFHSDQGIEYAAQEYRDLVAAAGMRRSMSRKTTPQDNAMVESLFYTLKTELGHLRKFENAIEAVAAIVEFMEFYNREWLHSGTGCQSPASYVRRACA